MTKQAYTARSDGWVAGRRVTAGEPLTLTPAQARYEPVDPARQGAKAKAAPRKGIVSPPDAAPEPEIGV